MSVVGLKFGGCVALMAVQTLSALAPVLLFKRCVQSRHQELLLSMSNVFSGGIMLGTSLSHLLPEAIESADALPEWLPFAVVGAAFVFSWFVFGVVLPKAVLGRNRKKSDPDLTRTEDSETEAQATGNGLMAPKHSGHHHASVPEVLSVVFVGALSFHSLFGGMVLGLQDQFAALLAIFLALIAHKWSEAFAMGSAMARDDQQMSWRKVAVLLACPPLSTLAGVGLGAIIVVWVTDTHSLMSVTSALSCGLFLFIAILDVLQPEIQLTDPWPRLAGKGLVCVGGFAVAVLLSVLFAE